MEPFQPWLAHFAITRLTDLLIHDEEDHKCDFEITHLAGDYDYGPLDIVQNPSPTGYGYITSVHKVAVYETSPVTNSSVRSLPLLHKETHSSRGSSLTDNIV